MKNAIRLRSGRVIGHGAPCFIVAELCNNHQGSPDMALTMIREAARCGADAVKLQKRHAESLLTQEGRNAPYPGKNSFGPTYGEHRKALELDMTAMAACKALAEELGLVFFASAWDRVSLEEMGRLGVELLKISSADMVCVPLLRQAGAMELPIIMSTGMSGLAEIDAAVDILSGYHDDLVLLHCNSVYPCPEERIGLPLMALLRKRYGLPVGYSGHERGLGPSVAAAALGACVVERHFTLDCGLPGTDHAASLAPEAFSRLCGMIRETELALRPMDKALSPDEEAAAKKLRKSIVFARDLPPGHVLTPADLSVKCPGDGVSPLRWDEAAGTVLTVAVSFEEPFAWDKVAPAGNAQRCADARRGEGDGAPRKAAVSK